MFQHLQPQAQYSKAWFPHETKRETPKLELVFQHLQPQGQYSKAWFPHQTKRKTPKLEQEFQHLHRGPEPFPLALRLLHELRLSGSDLDTLANSRRDAVRSIRARHVTIVSPNSASPTAVELPHASSGDVNAEVVEACWEDFARRLTAALAEESEGGTLTTAAREAVLARVCRLLTVNPAMKLMIKSGCPPQMSQPHYVVMCGKSTRAGRRACRVAMFAFGTF